MEGSRLMETFSTLAPRLWALGWRGLVPLRPNEKTPAIQRWQTYNQGQTEDELKELVEARVGKRAGSGVGVCSGNGLLFLDLDIEIQKALIRAVAIAEDILGITPLHRIGSPPKRVLMYRSDMPGMRRNPRDLAIELYGGGQPATGQVVLYGMHPKTRGPYHYLHQEPLEVPLEQIPEIYEEQVEDLIVALAADPLVREHGMVKARVQAGDPTTGRLGICLAEAARRRGSRGGLAGWVANAAPGGRHYAATAAATLLMSVGLDPDEETAELEAIEIAFREAKPESDGAEWRSILRWARSKAPRQTRKELARRLGLGVAHG